MSAPALAAPKMTWPDDLLTFARERGVADRLEPMLEVANRICPTANTIRVYLEPDYELHDVWFIVYEVRLPHLRPDEIDVVDREWLAEESRLFPGPNPCSLVLRLRPEAVG